MARESRAAGARMRTGICLQDDCELAKNKEKQTVRMGHDFVCKECGAELHEVKSGPEGPNWKLIGGIVAGVLVLGGGVATLLMGGDTKVETISLNKTLSERYEGDADTLVATVTPKDAKYTLIWTSSNPEVATVNSGLVNLVSSGEAVITVSVKEQPEMKAQCQVTVSEEDTDEEGDEQELQSSEGEDLPEGTNIALMKFAEPAINIKVGDGQIVTLIIEPENADETLKWTSSNEAVAIVTDNVVKGVAPGKAVITVESERSHTKATLEVTVEKAGTTTSGGQNPGGDTGGIVTKDLGYAVYKGKMKNGKMHDNNGVLTFKQKHIIESRDVKKRMAEPGEKVVGIFEDGHLTTGTWYKNDGNKETIIP